MHEAATIADEYNVTMAFEPEVSNVIDSAPRARRRMRAAGVSPVFHYVPLHSSPAGRRFGRAATPMPHTDRVSQCLLRLPLWIGVDRERVLSALVEALDLNRPG